MPPLSQPLNPTSFQHPFTPNNTITIPRASPLFTLPNLNFSKTSVQYVNGFLCFHPRSNIWLSSSSHVNAFTLIPNPTIRQFLTFPLDDSIVTKTEFLVSTHFRYDPVRDEFKVFRLVKYHGSYEFRIFTLDSDTSWRLLSAVEKPFFFMHCLLSHLKRGLCVNGAIHWTHSSSCVRDSGMSVVVFDLGTEQFRVMPSPSEYLYREENVGILQHPNLVEIDGCLCLVGYNEFGLKLWILRDQIWEEEIKVL